MAQKIHYPRVRPATDIVDLEDGIQITANMPGVNEQNLQVILEGNMLHITASSRCPVPAEKKDVQALEFGNVEFSLDIVMEKKSLRARADHSGQGRSLGLSSARSRCGHARSAASAFLKKADLRVCGVLRIFPRCAFCPSWTAR